MLLKSDLDVQQCNQIQGTYGYEFDHTLWFGHFSVLLKSDLDVQQCDEIHCNYWDKVDHTFLCCLSQCDQIHSNRGY